MSMAEDIENLYDDDFYDTDDSIFKDYIIGNLYWKTKDRNLINISEMTEQHIYNCMRIPTFHNKENWDIIFRYELIQRQPHNA